MINRREDGCLICGSPYVECHHIFHGSGYRKLSDKYGLVVYLCHRHHNEPPQGAHFNSELDLALKRVAQKAFEDEHGHEEYMRIFGRNYLDG